MVGAPPSSRPMLTPGTLLDSRYRVERSLGQGRAGVFLATRLQPQTKVVIRVLRASEPAASELLLREAGAALSAQSEHAAPVLDSGTLRDGSLYLVTEHLSGETLAELVEASGTLPVADALEYVLQACEAVAEAHTNQIVHRNLTPSNLFRTQRKDGSPVIKVLGFGVAGYMAAALQTRGASLPPRSLRYLAPEQVGDARRADARADVWALGAVLYELLAGVPPFVGDTSPDVVDAILHNSPPPLGSLRAELPAGLERVVERCLTKRVDERVASIVALARELAPFTPERLRPLLERIDKLEIVHAATTVPAPAGEPNAPLSEPYKAVGGPLSAPGVPTLPSLFDEVDEGDHTRIQSPDDELKQLVQATLPSSRRQKAKSMRKARTAPANDPSARAPTPDAPDAHDRPTAMPLPPPPEASSGPQPPPAPVPAAAPPPAAALAAPSPPALAEPPHVEPPPSAPSSGPLPPASLRSAPLPEVAPPATSKKLWLLVPVVLVLGALALRTLLASPEPGPTPTPGAPAQHSR